MSSGPRGPPSGTKLPGRPVPSAAGAVIPWVQTPSRSHPSCRCPLCPPGGAHGGRDQALPQGRTAGWAPGGNRSERSRLPVPAPSLARSFSPRDGCAPGRGGRGSHLVPWSNPAQRRGASVSAPGLGGPPDLPACHVPAFRPSGLRSRGPGPPASLRPMSRGPGTPASLGAEVWGPRSPCVPRGDVSGSRFPCVNRGRGLGAPVPPPSETRLEQHHEAPALKRQRGAWIASRRLDRIAAPSPAKRPQHRQGDDNALRRLRDAPGASEGWRLPEG